MADPDLWVYGSAFFGVGAAPRFFYFDRITGNVGIGTTTPSTKLVIQEANNANGIGINIFNTGTSNARISMGVGGAIPQFTLGVDQTDANKFKIGTTALATNTRLTIDSSGNVGIGTTTPSYKLDVNGDLNLPSTGFIRIAGNAGSSGQVLTRTSTGMAWQTVSGGDNLGNHIATTTLNMNNNNIINVNKISLNNGGAIDPVYEINGKKYATYAPFMIGVKEEVVSKGKLKKDGNHYKYVIDFAKLKEGSDLWVWYHIIDFSEDTVEAIATPIEDYASLYYKLEGNVITFYGDKPVEFSFRLTGARKDNANWPTQIE